MAINNDEHKPAANPGYAATQLEKALARLQQDLSEDDQRLAASRAKKWTEVLKGMASGVLSIGSRQPVAEAPAWVTLDVVHGGFATGGFVAGGPLSESEQTRASRLRLSARDGSRLALNKSYLTDEGLNELLAIWQSGCYAIRVPEHAALMVVALLAALDHVKEAAQLLSTIEPWFRRLRFYPEPLDMPAAVKDTVHVESVRQVMARLMSIEEHARILTQNESLLHWVPLHDEFIQLLVDSCENSTAQALEELGEPFQRCDAQWRSRASNLLLRYADVRARHHLSGKPERRGEVFYEVRRLVRKQLELPIDQALPNLDVKRAQELLRRDFHKRGALKSLKRAQLRAQQSRIGLIPTHAQSAQLISARLKPFDQDTGLAQPEAVLQAELNEIEQARLYGQRQVTQPTFQIPETIERKVLRCLEASLDELVERGLISSGDVLARFVPQIAGRAMAVRFTDEALRQIYLQTYQAFRARRSLLLLNLEKQVQFDELPWVKSLLNLASPAFDAQQSPRRALCEIAALNLVSFPFAIVPNKLLQEFRALAEAAGLSLPLLDELAADIFMGEFSRKFGQAAQLAAQQLEGSLYANYYEINTAHLLKMNFNDKKIATGLGEICAHRARVRPGSRSPATNGCVIEQQQILTTQNLASLWSIPEIRERLQPELGAMVQTTFRWLIEELAARRPHAHARMIAIKNAAYAWRQMIFYLSQLSEAEIYVQLDSMHEVISKFPGSFANRFSPALMGLRNAVNGQPVEWSEGKSFLGWSTESHWLL